MPISLGEHPAHIEYVRSLVRDYQPVTRNTSRSYLEKYYKKKRAALVQELERGTLTLLLLLMFGEVELGKITLV